MPLVVPMSPATFVTLPSVAIFQSCPVLLSQFGSLAYSVPSGAMATSFGWFIFGS
jgi:hypothetical protein